MSNLVHSKELNLSKSHNINEFDKRSFYSKQNDLHDFNDTLETSYYDTEKSSQTMKLRKKT